MKKRLVFISVSIFLALTACGNNASQESPSNNQQGSHQGHSGMTHASTGEIPAGLKAAQNPTYKVGSQAIILNDHMEGMKGATATIVGAYDTTVYAISYTPTTGGDRVTNHKWVIHEEIQNAGAEPYKPGTDVVVVGDHMPGMKGATATIESTERTTIYMVDYTPTTGGEPVKNHQWVTESELSAK
ncbi:DUF1541 domain-containing protein [Brevibacillus choshinensis]|uniref:DUF1541 domain-containing protein n=1 Tax=Brevibacillus choshinensis TaxID=54911 RepID=A0ABX7FG84_BRECH|nr:DUF1541 domain-containing protein [Brevibacillus choshinensis]QRG65194.1 DUF1541 domain-containing protein [Brevibacillus choshinensis]